MNQSNLHRTMRTRLAPMETKARRREKEEEEDEEEEGERAKKRAWNIHRSSLRHIATREREPPMPRVNGGGEAWWESDLFGRRDVLLVMSVEWLWIFGFVLKGHWQETFSLYISMDNWVPTNNLCWQSRGRIYLHLNTPVLSDHTYIHKSAS